jgi:hypothetical protein
LGSLDSTETRRLIEADSAGVFVPPDFILFVRQETLYAQRLDLGKLTLAGDPFLGKERVTAGITNQIATIALSASKTGLIAYRAAGVVRHQLTWFDRSGRPNGTLGEADEAQGGLGLNLSPKGEFVTLNRVVNGNNDIFVMDGRGVRQRFTFDVASDSGGVWSPDGTRIAFASYRKGLNDIYVKPFTGGNEQPLLESSENKLVSDWSPDGRFILYSSQNPKTARDLWALPLEGNQKPFAVVQTAFEDTAGQFSPDSRWVAYQSNESGRTEVYVQPFPGPGRHLQLSINGGSRPQWRGDGSEVFFISPDNRVMTVRLKPPANNLIVEAEPPVELFKAPSAIYAATRDGEHFLIDAPLEQAPTPAITVILNWAGRKK